MTSATPTTKKTTTVPQVPLSSPTKATPKIPKLTELLAGAAEASKPNDAFYIPDVVGHFMLIALPEKNEKLGNVYIPDAVAESERAAAIVGRVIKLGSECYIGSFPNGALRYPKGPWCKEGDNVVFGRYTGHRIRIGGVEFRILADDQIIATVDEDALKEISGL